MEDETLTLKQQIFFEKLKNKYQNAPLPSYEVIKEQFNIKYKNSVAQYFKALRNKDFILEKNKRFFINPNLMGAPLCTTSIRAGFQSAIEDSMQRRISFDAEFNINSPSTFVFTVSGDSMTGLGIYEGDNVIINKTTDVKDGDIVMASVDGTYTLKTYRKKDNKVWLQPANPLYSDIVPKEYLHIFGVAIGITRKLK